MANKVFIVLASGDKDVAMLTALEYPLRCAKNKWMDEIKVIIFGPSERLLAFDADVQARVKEIQAAGVEVMACRPPAERLGVTQAIEKLGIKVEYVGPIISQMMKDGWTSMTF